MCMQAVLVVTKDSAHLSDRKLRPPGDVYVQSLLLPSGRHLAVFIHPWSSGTSQGLHG